MDNKYVDAIVDIIDANEDLITYDYKDKKNQILIAKELVDKMITYVKNEKNEKFDLKELLKRSIKKAFELLENDVVISKNGHFFIKILDESTKGNVKEEDKGTVANRYNGIEEDELRSCYEELFEDGANEDFFDIIATDFFTKYFMEEKISNDTYEKNVFMYIQNITTAHLLTMYDDDGADDAFFKGFSGYIFRLHFKDVFEHIADLLLQEITLSNAYVKSFLNYYSLSVIVENGNKYQVPIIKAKNGMQWSVISMLSTAKIYVRARKSMDVLLVKSDKLDDELSSFYIDDKSPVEFQNLIIKQRRAIDKEIDEETGEYGTCKDLLETTKDAKTREELKLELEEISEYINELERKKRVLVERTVSPSAIKQYSELQKKFDFSQRQFLTEKKIVAQNEITYSNMRASLVKALIAKKKMV